MSRRDRSRRADRPSGPGWALAPLGLLLVGAGVSVSIDAGLRRAAGAPGSRWLSQGAVGLVTLNSGLSVFGDAVARAASRR